MSTRKLCFYKGCNSSQYGDKPCSETFFQFPRDEERYKLWMRNSQCEDNTNVKTIKYLCSKHFDHHKFISSNPRRKLLLANAVPFKYQSEDEGEQEDEEFQDVVSTQFNEVEDKLIHEMHDIIDMENAPNYAGSTIKDDNLIEQKAELITLNGQNKRKLGFLECSDSVTITKTKLSRNSIQLPSSVTKKNQLHVTIKPSICLNEDKPTDFSEDELISNSNITSFIFEGKAYVQMPKSVYIKEKSELLRDLMYYKNIVVNLKKQLSNVEF